MNGINFIQIIYLTIILAISIGLHEYAHALVSDMLGDPTPKIQKRLTPNPMAHLDPIGFLMIFFVHFGRGKPVQVNPAYYKNPLKGELMVALAGPATNMILAIFGIIFMMIYIKFMGINPGGDMFVQFWLLFSQINITLAIFNLLPLPPLDGYRLIKFFNPQLGFTMEKNAYFIFPILILFIFTIGGVFIAYITHYIFNLLSSIIGMIIL